MVKEITKQASTVEEATELALQELNIKKEKAKIEIISTGGLFEKAEVKVSVQDNALEMVTEFLNGIIAKMGMKISAKITEDKDDISIIITGEDAAKVIAHRGEVLDSFQVIILSYLNQYGYEHKKVSIDCDSYREKRTATLSALAVKMANKAYSMGREIEFEPMNPFERRVIHTALQDSTIVKTQSEGFDDAEFKAQLAAGVEAAGITIKAVSGSVVTFNFAVDPTSKPTDELKSYKVGQVAAPKTVISVDVAVDVQKVLPKSISVDLASALTNTVPAPEGFTAFEFSKASVSVNFSYNESVKKIAASKTTDTVPVTDIINMFMGD